MDYSQKLIQIDLMGNFASQVNQMFIFFDSGRKLDHPIPLKKVLEQSTKVSCYDTTAKPKIIVHGFLFVCLFVMT